MRAAAMALALLLAGCSTVEPPAVEPPAVEPPAVDPPAVEARPRCECGA